jgi:hypothetical protein
MEVNWNLDSREAKSRTCSYVYTTSKAEAEEWLLEDGKLFHGSFTKGVDTFATWMARDLDAFAAKTELDEGDDAPASCYQESLF